MKILSTELCIKQCQQPLLPHSMCNDLTVCKAVEKKMMMIMYSFPNEPWKGRRYLVRHV